MQVVLFLSKSFQVANEEFVTWILLICDLETSPTDYQKVTRASEKAKIIVNYFYKTGLVNASY